MRKQKKLFQNYLENIVNSLKYTVAIVLIDFLTSSSKLKQGEQFLRLSLGLNKKKGFLCICQFSAI